MPYPSGKPVQAAGAVWGAEVTSTKVKMLALDADEITKTLNLA